MDTQEHLDTQFDENLRYAAADIPIPPGPASEVFSRCMSELQSPTQRRHWFSSGRAILVSALSAAAVLALTTSVFFASRDGSTANAAMILARFDEQIQSGSVIDLTIKSLTLDDAYIDGTLIIGEDTIAGDMRVTASDDEYESPVEVDFALGFSRDAKWLLLRKLSIPDPEAAPYIAAFFPPGSETLITLPNDENSAINLGLSDHLGVLNSAELIKALEQVVQENANEGSTVAKQADGTVLLTLPLGNVNVLNSLSSTLGESVNQLNIGAGTQRPANPPAEKSGFNFKFSYEPNTPVSEIIERETAGKDAIVINAGAQRETPPDADDDGDLHEFAGSTLAIRYDPATDSIRSIEITDIGPTKGSISIAVRNGTVDPAVLDANRIMTPATRRLDLGAIASMISSFGGGASNKD